MRANHLAAAAGVSFSCVLVTASCIQSPTPAAETRPDEANDSDGALSINGGLRPPQGPPIGEAQQESGRAYQSKDFPFVVIVKDDGEGPSGGWQAAEKTFHFVERDWLLPVYLWQCPVRIEVPLRCKVWGPITPSRAALYSAEVATEVVDPLLESRLTWRNQGTVFCQELQSRMEATFKAQYPGLGARVRRL